MSSVFEFDEMLMNDKDMDSFIEQDKKHPNKLANILFEEEP